MQKNTAGQKILVFAFDKTTNDPVTGDALNITANLKKDFAAAAATDDINPTETEDGFYEFTMLQAETNANAVQCLPQSSTANVQVIAVPGIIYTTLNSLAQEALEDQYDGTGLIGDNYPASQAQVGNISTGSAAISKRAASGVVNVGVVIGGTTYENTYTLDGNYHSIADDAGNLNVEYGFDVGGNGVAVEVVMDGYFSGNGDVLAAQAWNWIGSVWEDIGSLIAASGTENMQAKFNLDVEHTGTGANAGEIKIRGYEAAGGLSAVQLNMDRVFISYSIVAQSVGYDGGQVWINTVDGEAGTEIYINGTADNQSLTLADAIAIAAAIPLDKFQVSNKSTILFAEAHTDEVWSGDGWKLQLGGRDISNTHIYHCNDISGIGTSPTGEMHILDSHIGAVTLGECHITGGSFKSTFNAGVAGAYHIENSKSGVAGADTPVLTFSGLGAPTTLDARGWMGGGAWVFDSFCTASIEVLLGGTHTITAGGGNVEFRGTPKALVINTSVGSVINIIVWSGCPITINGSGGTINIDGVHGGITNNATGVTLDSSGSTDITQLNAVLEDTSNIQPKIGAPSVNLAADIATRMAEASINTTAGKIDGVALVDVTTANTDMRGTNGANTTPPDNASIAAILNDTDVTLPAMISALNNISTAEILASGDVDGYSIEQALKLILASAAGVLAGAATTQVTIEAADGLKTRITATVDADGNRSVVVLDATG